MKKIFTYLLTLFIFSACSSGEPGLSETAEDEADIFFSPPATDELPVNQGTAIENKIETVDILVFGSTSTHSADKTKGFKYYRPAWRAKEQYKSTLKIEDNVTLWFFINCQELITVALQDGTAHTGKSPGEILELLIESDPDRFTKGETPLPMWGGKKGYKYQ